jgi:starvation-inducible DNA-binding protein
MNKLSQVVLEPTEVLAGMLNSCLADGIDLHSQIKVAHWNVKGPQFASLHPLFDQFAAGLALHNDNIAERAVMLGAEARGTVRAVAKHSRLPDYPVQTRRGLHHVQLLLQRFEIYLVGLRDAKATAERLGDSTTSDLLAAVIGELEKNIWFLNSSLEDQTS